MKKILNLFQKPVSSSRKRGSSVKSLKNNTLDSCFRRNDIRPRNLFLLILFTISLINNVYAISISEIMYDPSGSDTGREWVEIFNNTESDIDFTSYKFNESGTNHSIATYSTDKIIKANSYGVIADNPAKFLIDNPTYAGILYDSSFSLSNTGELIVLKDNSLAQIDSINYSSAIGGNDDGSTLSFINGNWTRGKATPGLVNIEELKATSTEATTTETTSVTYITPIYSSPLPDIFLLLPEKVDTVAGADKVFSVKAVNSSRKEIDGLDYVWTFGDGGSKNGKNVSYHYSYPGFYNVVVEAVGVGYSERGRLKTIVNAPQLSIAESNIGVAGLYIDLKNFSQTEVDLSGWILDINSGFYVIPKNTILSANSVTRLSGLSLGVASSTINSWQKNFINAKLFYPDHSLVLNYNSTTSIATLENKESGIKNKEDVSSEARGAKSDENARSQQTKDLAKLETQNATTTATTTGVVLAVGPARTTPPKFSPTKIISKPKTLEIKNETATTTQIVKVEKTKDIRIVNWFKNLFGL